MNLLITGAWKSGEDYKEEIERMGHTVAFAPREDEAFSVSGDWVEGLICSGGFFASHDIRDFPNLRYLQVESAGLDKVPLDYVREHGIELHNARGVYSVPMAEYAVGGVLSLYKHLAGFEEKKKAHRWEKDRGLSEIFGKTVAVIGCGSIGTECAKRFSAFGCRVVGVDAFPREAADYAETVGLSELDGTLKTADVVVLTVPLSEGTFHLMNAERLALLKPTAVLVSMARGPIVDEKALVETLPKIGGAVLDVFEEEPLSEKSPLWDMENVILTPHNSFIGENNRARLDKVIMGNLRK